MKKLSFFIMCLVAMAFTLASCGSACVYEITGAYDVLWRDGTKTDTSIVYVISKDKPYVVQYSIGGSNYISAMSTFTPVAVSPNEKIHRTATILASNTAELRLHNGWKVTKVPKKGKKIVNNQVSSDRAEGYKLGE